MPKVIENIEEKIMEVATKRFQHQFYTQVDARSIAKEVGISVGTLYNNFPTKQDIFIAVLDLKFGEIEKRLTKTLSGTEPFNEKMLRYVQTLYHMTHEAAMLHRNLTYLFIIEDEIVKRHSKTVHQRYQELMKTTVFPIISQEYPAISEEAVRKILTVMRASTLFFVRFEKCTEDRLSDIEMLHQILMTYFEQKNQNSHC